MATQWIDFGALKEAADFTAILAHYDIKARRTGVQLSARCPFHEDAKPSLKVNLDKRAFHCFGCGAKGNPLDFVQRMEGGSLREAAETLAAICNIPLPQTEPPTAASRSPKDSREPRQKTKAPSRPERGQQPSERQQEAVNPPLTFELKLDPEHPYLAERGLAPDVIAAFGLGHCARGMMTGRVCIPIRNTEGELVAYAGRWAGPDDAIPDGEDKYKLPPKFRKAAVVFNLHRVADADHLIVVEGYFSVFRLHALEAPAVALMGRDLSDAQIALLSQSGATRLTLMLDGDEPGRTAAESILPRLARSFFVRVVNLPDGFQPDTVDEDLIATLLELA